MIDVESMLVKLKDSCRLNCFGVGLDVCLKKIGDGFIFTTGSPWGTFADFLIDAKSREWIGVTFEANGADIAKAVSLAESFPSFVKFIDKHSIAHRKYPVANEESAFAEIFWSRAIDVSFVSAQCDDVVFGYSLSNNIPVWLGVDSVSVYLEEYDVCLPKMHRAGAFS